MKFRECIKILCNLLDKAWLIFVKRFASGGVGLEAHGLHGGG